jgi:peptidoglycan/LPS O-acetylase OafA/YrhL
MGLLSSMDPNSHAPLLAAIGPSSTASQNKEPTHPLKSQQPQNRFLFIDALRAIAALMVVFYHCFLCYIPHDGFPLITRIGARGVQIFLVISGFVITHSLRNVSINASATLNFLLRRFIRLTPVYWVAIGITLFSCLVSIKMGLHDPGMMSGMTLSAGTIFVNATYMQGVLNAYPICHPAWILCIEVQFYIFYIVLLWALSLGKRNISIDEQNFRMSIAMFAVGVVSCFYFKSAIRAVPWVFPFLSYFACGSLIHSAMTKRVSYALPLFFPLAAVALAAAKLLFHTRFQWFDTFSIKPDAPIFFGTLSGLLIASAAYFRKMEAWSGGPVLQYLGKISYSIYLIHMPSLWVCYYVIVIKLGLFPNTPVKIALFLIAGFLATTIAAQTVYTLIENPSARFASRLKSGSGRLNAGQPHTH